MFFWLILGRWKRKSHSFTFPERAICEILAKHLFSLPLFLQIVQFYSFYYKHYFKNVFRLILGRGKQKRYAFIFPKNRSRDFSETPVSGSLFSYWKLLLSILHVIIFVSWLRCYLFLCTCVIFETHLMHNTLTRTDLWWRFLIIHNIMS